MCGIWATLGKPIANDVAKALLKKLAPRGPEGARLMNDTNYQLGFTRLAINGLNDDGMQPMSSEQLRWICNGEIYNWRDLAQRYGFESKSGSDCEVLGPLFGRIAKESDARTFFRALDGVFATVIVDSEHQVAVVGRDPYGVRPLFVGYVAGASATATTTTVVDSRGQRVPVETIVFASEMKALPPCAVVEVFPPGYYAAYDLRSLQRVGFEQYHTVPWLKSPVDVRSYPLAAGTVQRALEDAVKKRLMTERPAAALLSGGLDSSLIAAIVQKFLKESGAPPLKTFSIGFEGSEDLKYARLVADHIGSEHHEIIMTPEEFLDAIPDVINDIESYDITTVRASVGNWLVSKAIKNKTDCKVVFNGDGSDEVFGGYLYFYNAPSDEAFEAESGRLLEHIHFFDVLRSDRSISSHGLEARTPFLDKQFVAVVRSVATHLRRPVKGEQVEKWILRMAFEHSDLLPREVLWRKKEAFSDGVSGEKSWYQICQEHAAAEVGEDWDIEAGALQHLMPRTAEAWYYRKLFRKHYAGLDTVTVPYHWMPKWSAGATDPSARTLAVYN